MTKCVTKVLFFLILTILLSCTETKKSDDRVLNQTIKANPYVESFTSGVISKNDPIIINLNSDVPEHLQSNKSLKELITVKPEVNFICLGENNRIMLSVGNGFDPGTVYEISVDLGKMFEGAEKFKYKFRTITPKAELSDITLKIGSDGMSYYSAMLHTADLESAETVRSLLYGNDIGDIVVGNNNNNRSTNFEIEIRNLKEKTAGKKVPVMIKANKAGYPVSEIGEITVPDFRVFDIYEIKTGKGGKYIDVVFNQNLSQSQDFYGYYNIKDFPDTRYTTHGNILRLWINDDDESEVKETTLRIYDGITNSRGERLTKEKSNNESLFFSKINLDTDAPYLGFVSSGNILPAEGGKNILFESRSLKGVIVRVIKIYQNNIDIFLQNNNLSGQYNLAQVGDLLARKVIFFEDMGDYDLSKKNVYGINLSDFIDVDKGAIYNVTLSYTYDLSAYPVNDREQLSKEELIANALIEETEEKERLQNSDYYFFYDNKDGYGNWSDRNNPEKTSYYYNKKVSKNILSSDIGLIAKKGNENNEITFVTNNINTSAVLPGVSVHVFDYRNREIGSGTTDKNGFAVFNLDKGTPLYAIAKRENERGYIRLRKAEALSVSDFNVEGEEIQKGIKGFLYTDRGVWRPGDSIYISFILNENSAQLPENHPVKVQLYNPHDIMTSQKVTTKGVNGFYSFALKTDEDDPTGVWKCDVSVGGAKFSRRLRIETIKPNRLSIDLSFDKKIIMEGTPVTAKLHSAWLTGAKASGLNYDININFQSKPTVFADFKNFVFDNPFKTFEAKEILFGEGRTDKEGDATIRRTLNVGEDAPGMLRAEFITKVYEEAGSFSITGDAMTYSPYSSYVGVYSPQREDEALLTSQNHEFRIATVDPSGTPVGNVNCDVKIYKGRWYWWWDNSGSSIADYISSSYSDPVDRFYVETASDGIGEFNMNISDSDWGVYVIVVRNKESGQECVIKTYFDYDYYIRSPEDGRNNKAARLAITTDKNDYKVNEDIRITFPSVKGAHALVTIENGSEILEKKIVKCDKETTTHTIKAKKEFLPNVYVGVTLVNPYANTTDLPVRLYGVVPVNITDPATVLQPVIKSPEDIRPGSEFEISVSEKNKQDMTFTLALVDCGLLDLTRFKTPDPWSAFNAKEALGVSTWDIYDMVVGAYAGKIERIYNIGGDSEIDHSATAALSRFKPVVIFKGPYSLKGGRTEKIKINMPEYIGKVRCMVIAGNNKEEAYGSASKDITVKQTVMVTGTLPRELNPGDEFSLPVTVFAMEDNVGEVEVTLKGSLLLGADKPMTKKVSINKKGSTIVCFDLKVKDDTGAGFVSVNATSKNEKASWESDIAVVSNMIPVIKTETVVIEGGKSATLSISPVGIPGSNKGSLELSAVKPLNLSNRIDYLLNYPFECIEQTVSRGFPLMYIAPFTNASMLRQGEITERTINLINSLPKYMIPGGAFSYWPGGTSAAGWGSVYALHFMTEALSNGFSLPGNIYRNSLDYEKEVAKGWSGKIGNNAETLTQAYRLYVLALAGTPVQGAMNRLREGEYNYSTQSLLAAAYACTGRDDVAMGILKREISYDSDAPAYMYTYGDDIRSKALRLIALTSVDEADASRILVDELSSVLASESTLNTQNTAFSLIAVTGFFKKYPPAESVDASISGTLKANADDEEEPFYSYPLDMSKDQKITVKNNGKGTLYATISASGVPLKENLEANSNGMSISVDYYTNEGDPIDIKNIKMGTNFNAEITVRNISVNALTDIMVSQVIPSGWEILNTRYLNDAKTNQSSGVTYQDIRDCRINSYIPILQPNAGVSIPVKLCASYAGTYFLPPAFCEVMYSPSIRANTAGMEIKVIRD